MSQRTIPVAIVAIAALVFSFFSTASAALIRVPTDQPTIQSGIDAGVNGDTVVVLPGTYFEHDISFNGKRLIVSSVAPSDTNTVFATVVDADSLGRVFLFNSGETATSVLAGLTLTNGYGVGGSGGGVHCASSSPSIKWCVFKKNRADFGGGIGLVTSNSKIDDCRFVSNECIAFSEDGGAAFIASSSNPIFTRCLFEKNKSPYNGGAIAIGGQTLTIVDCTFRGNTAEQDGGAIYSELNRAISAVGCLFFANRAVTGESGAIYSWGTLTLEGCAFTDNDAATYGGAVMRRTHTRSTSACFRAISRRVVAARSLRRGSRMEPWTAHGSS